MAITAQLVKWLKALADEKRLQIIELVSQRSVCVCELEGLVGLTQPAVSHHLKILREAGLVNDTRQGKWVFYSLNRTGYSALQAALAAMLSQGGSQEEEVDETKRCQACE